MEANMPQGTGESSSGSKIKWVHLLTLVSVGVLVGSEVFGVAFATGWAISGLLELGLALSYAMDGLFLLLAALVMIPFMRHAAKVDPLRE
jgi:hypothetical protein